MIKSTDFAYAAGYIDGDGCFQIGKEFCKDYMRFRHAIIINSTEIENIHWFQTKFGGNISSNKKSVENQKTMHRYVIKGKSLDVIEGIGKFLVEKKDQFDVFETFRKSFEYETREFLIQNMNLIKSEHHLIFSSIKDELNSIKNSIVPSSEDFAYLAGFIDSECCLNVQRYVSKNTQNPVYKIQLQCNNTKSPCFYWMSRRFGGQFHFIDRSHFKTPHRNQMTWRLSSASLYPVLQKIQPFLIHKKPVCNELIKFHETALDRSKAPSPNSPLFEEYYRPIREERENIFHKIQLLNKKGI